MIQLLLALASCMTGVSMTVQSAVNGKLRNITSNPIFASAASFGGGLILLFLMLFGAHVLGIYHLPGAEVMMQTKPWMYVGGLVGTCLVVGSIMIPKRIGFASYFSMLVAGQLVGSVLADAIGFLGAEPHMPTPARLVGLAFLIAGAVLIQKR